MGGPGSGRWKAKPYGTHLGHSDRARDARRRAEHERTELAYYERVYDQLDDDERAEADRRLHEIFRSLPGHECEYCDE